MNAIPSRGFKGPSASETNSEAEPEETLVNAFTAELTSVRDFHKAVQPWETGGGIYHDVACGVTRRSRSVATRSGKMRRVRSVEGFRPELEFKAFGNSEFAENSQIQVRSAWAPQRIEAHCPEPGRSHRHEGGRVIER